MGTRKERYIELHGEEAWKEKMKKERVRYIKERDRRVAWQREYNEKNRERINQRQRVYDAKYFKSKRGRAAYLVTGYRTMDRERGLGETTITQEWILENIFTGKCIYCGEADWRKLGCDRIDNTKSHTPDNVVCACLNCNNQRSDRWTWEEFIEHKKTKGRP